MAPRPITKPRCHNCRRRKIKSCHQCDYSRPSCSQCIRSGLDCEGYDHSLIFVSHNSPKPDAVAPASSSAAAASSKARSQARASRTKSSSPSLSPSPSPDPASDRDYRQLHQFLAEYVPQASCGDMLALKWLQDLPRFRGRFQPLDTAVDAICDMVHGVAHGSESHSSRGIARCGRALGELREAHTQLARKQNWRETLLTSMILQLYEIIDFSSPPSEGWHSHIVGIMMLVEMAGERVTREPGMLSTLTYSRLEMVSRAILGGSQYLYSSPWCTQPWTDFTDDPLHQILDMMVLVPGYTDLAETTAASPCAEPERSRFREYHQHLTGMLQDCYAQQASGVEMPCWVQAQHFFGGASSDLCGSSTTDAPCMSLSACHRLLLMWVAKIVLYNGTDAVRRSEPIMPDSPSQDLQGNIEWFAALKTIEDMAHAVSHCLHPDNGIFGMQLTILPLRIMYLFAMRHGLVERQQWCHSVADELLRRNYRIASWSVFGPTPQVDVLADARGFGAELVGYNFV